MGQFFAKLFSPPAPTVDPKASPLLERGTPSSEQSAIMQVKRARDNLSKSEKSLKLELQSLTQRARAAATSGNREAALRVIKVKKMKEKHAAMLASKIDDLEHMIDSFEVQRHQKGFLDALKQGTEALKAIQGDMTADRAQEILEDAEDSRAAVDELSSIWSSHGTGQSDDTLLSELDELAAQTPSAARVVLSPVATLDLPAVPTDALPSAAGQAAHVHVPKQSATGERVAVPA